MGTIAEQRRLVVRAAIRWTLILGGLGAAAALAVARDPMLAASVALGALAVLLHFSLLALALGGTLGRAAPTPNGSGRTPRFAAASALRWPALVVALLGILWYMPARPQGLVAGLVLGLAAATFAAVGALRATRPPA
jgi:hypothetical protein